LEISERIQSIRKKLGLSRRAFGEKLGVSESVIVNIEYDRLAKPEQKEPLYKLICREFNINEDYLRTGKGEMFIELPEEDETAALVYELLGPEKNELFDMILEVIRTYKELSPGSQKVIREFCKKYIENIRKKGD